MMHALAILFCWVAATAATPDPTNGLRVGPRPFLVFMPIEWVRAGFPPVVDRSRPIDNSSPLLKFKTGIITRGMAKQLVLPRDFEMVEFLLVRFPGRHGDYDNFVSLPKYFMDTAYEARAKALLRPLLRGEGVEPCTKALAAYSLARMDDKQALWDMLAALPNARGVAAKLLRRSIVELGQVLPPDAAPPDGDE